MRLKPRGVNNLNTLREQGVDHIELRMFDLNPLVPGGIDERDLTFAQLFLVWLAATPREAISTKAQVQAVQNFKNTATTCTSRKAGRTANAFSIFWWIR